MSFGRGMIPAGPPVLPIRLPCTTLRSPRTTSPKSTLAAMRFPAPVVVPPTVLSNPSIRTPTALGSPRMPSAVVPTRLPWITFLSEATYNPKLKKSLLPEITLPSPGLVPPIVLSPPNTSTPM